MKVGDTVRILNSRGSGLAVGTEHAVTGKLPRNDAWSIGHWYFCKGDLEVVLSQEDEAFRLWQVYNATKHEYMLFVSHVAQAIEGNTTAHKDALKDLADIEDAIRRYRDGEEQAYE